MGTPFLTPLGRTRRPAPSQRRSVGHGLGMAELHAFRGERRVAHVRGSAGLGRRGMNEDLARSAYHTTTHQIEDNTFIPPVPSTTFPDRLSTTLACSTPPSTLSSTLPSPPQTVMPATHPARARPAQNGSRTADVAATANAPPNPAASPVGVTPPFVPRGTTRRLAEVSSRGGVGDRMPSSEERVSAATAA